MGRMIGVFGGVRRMSKMAQHENAETKNANYSSQLRKHESTKSWKEEKKKCRTKSVKEDLRKKGGT